MVTRGVPAVNPRFTELFGGEGALPSPRTPEAPLPPYLGGGQPMSFAQAMPGQLEAIAAQLSAGFGQPAGTYLSQMDALYNPINVPMTPAPAAPAPAPPERPNPFRRDSINLGGRDSGSGWTSSRPAVDPRYTNMFSQPAPAPREDQGARYRNIFRPQAAAAPQLFSDLLSRGDTINRGGSR